MAMARRPASERPPLPPDDSRHGTNSGYNHWRCRCERCRAWRSAESARHYTANAETERRRKADYYAANVEKLRAYRAEWYVKNADRERATDALYRAANADKRREYNARYRIERADKISAQRRSPQGRATSRVKSSRRRERSERRYCGCDTRENLAAVWLLDSGRCAYCNAPGTDYEHVVPLAKGGWGCVSNFRIACKSCNSKKRTLPLTVFLERLAASGVIIRPGATNSGLPCPAAAERLSRRMITA